jgi:hypothetical protein
MASSYWQSQAAPLSLRYPLTPILEDDYFGCDDCDAAECDGAYHNDADDEDEEEIATLASRHLFASPSASAAASKPRLDFEDGVTEELFESLESRDSIKK